MSKDYLFGLDVGQANDPSTLVGVEREPSGNKFQLRVGLIHLFPLGTQYAKVINATANLLADKRFRGRSNLGIDMTSVGRPIVEQARENETLSDITWGITFTSGQNVGQNGMDLKVPKKDMVGCMQMLLQDGLITCDPGLPGWADMRSQLASYQIKHTQSAENKFEGRGKNHDDIVSGIIMIAWLSDLLPIEENDAIIAKATTASGDGFTILEGLNQGQGQAPSWRDKLNDNMF